MNFVIPDEVLDNSVCKSCQRFLSVLPVKIYPNDDMKCGRCSQDDETGTVSSFGLVAEKSLFKCVNRFDGCRRLLECCQVLDHEAECVAKKYICPCCSKSEEMPTYLLPKHFKDMHPSAVLDRPFFGVDLGKSWNDFYKVFFHRLQDDLFLIYFWFNETKDEILLNTFHFGEGRRTSLMKQKFFVHCTGVDVTIETDAKSCISYSGGGLRELGKSNGFTIKLTDISTRQYIYVELKLDVLKATEIITMSQKVVPSPPTPRYMRGTFRRTSVKRFYKKSDKSTNTEEQTETTAEENGNADHFRRHSTLCFQKNLTLPRRLFLDTYFKKYNPDLSTDLDFYKLIRISPAEKVTIILPCFVCSELNYDLNSYRKSVFLRNQQSYQWVCSPCYRFLRREETDQSKFAHAALLLEHDVYKIVQHFCVWGCATPLYYTDIFKHESTCVSQPSQSCPVFGCTYTGKLFEIEKHFASTHPSPLFFSLRSSFLTKINRSERNVFQWYVWTPPFFVLVKFSWSVSHWLVSTNICGMSSTVLSKCLLFDKDWDFLKSVDNSKTSLDEREDLRIKCYIC